MEYIIKYHSGMDRWIIYHEDGVTPFRVFPSEERCKSFLKEYLAMKERRAKGDLT